MAKRGTATKAPRAKGPSRRASQETATEAGAGPLATAEVGEIAERPPRPHQARQYALKRFAEELPAIIKTYAKAAIEGDIPSLKALMTLSGFDRDDAHAPLTRTRRGKSLAKLLLNDLKKHPPGVPRNDEGTGGLGR